MRFLKWDTSKLPRVYLWGTLFIFTGTVIGACLGRLISAEDIDHARRALAEHVGQEDPFTLPPAPPVKEAPLLKHKSAEVKADTTAASDKARADMGYLRMWELTARQPLPPRPEPLTPPKWRIVGTTMIGHEKRVLLLFENQPAPEERKIGDKLPGGATIREIEQSHLKILLNGQLLTLSLVKQ